VRFLQANEGKLVSLKGPSIKYVTLEEERVREGVTVCDSGKGGPKACEVTL